MERFEYLVARVASDRVVWLSDGRDMTAKPSAHEYLNALGREGWELVAVTESEVTDGGFSGLWGDSHYVQDLFFKRRIVA